MPTDEGAKVGQGDGLAYPEWMTKRLPTMRRGFKVFNRYFSVPALRMGLGGWMSNPLTGYLMILRTRGRKTGEMRDAPLGYVIVDDAVYCIAGFGPTSHWYRNILADSRVEVILPDRAISGLAEEVVDPDEQLRVLPVLMRSMSMVAGTMGLGDPRQDSPEQIVSKCEGMPLVRISVTGIAAGPNDPGGLSWVVPTAVTVAGVGWLLRRLFNSKR